MSNTKILFQGKYLNLVERDGWEFVTRNHKDVVVIFPILKGKDDYGSLDKVILIDEFRHPLRQRVLSLPAGLVGDKGGSESIYDAAIRELEEETGYKARTISVALENCPSSSGMTSETFNLLIAKDLELVSDGGGDESEDIEVKPVLLTDLSRVISEYRKEGRLVDPKIFAALWFWEHWDELR